jgi:hypothetical protein
LAFVCGGFSDGIVMWVKKKTGPAIDFIKSSTDAQELLEQDTPVAVAFLQDFEVDFFLPPAKHTTLEGKKFK